MINLNYPEMSPLNCNITRDGITVEITIYRDGTPDWSLEVTDETGASTVWDDRFETDQAALDEIQRVIEKDGIASIVKLQKYFVD